MFVFVVVFFHTRPKNEVQIFAQKLPFMNISWLYVLVWLWSLLVAITANEEKKCNSVIIRSIDRLSALHNCTYVDGSVQIVLLDNTKPTDFDISFPLLKEITQFLLVYRVSGLETLGKLFPNLMLIRGIRSPAFPGLALMIHDNEDLQEIGLYSLTNITQGSVIITKNKSELNYVYNDSCMMACLYVNEW